MSRAGHVSRLHESGPVDDRPELAGVEPTVVFGAMDFAGIGWHITADALLANTAAVRAREHRRTVREELTTRNLIEKG